MITVTCSCGKVVYGSESMAGQDVQCFQCRKSVTLPGTPPPAPSRKKDLGFGGLWTITAPTEMPAPAAAAETMAEPTATPTAPQVPSRWRDSLYWVLLLTLMPLLLIVLQEKEKTPLQRLKATLAAHPELKVQVELLLESPNATLDRLLGLLPGGRLDEKAHLPRKTELHWVYAGWAAAGFFVLVGIWMASGFASWWKLVLAAAFTGTFGIAILFLFHDWIGHDKQLTLEAEHGFVINMIGFTLIVGLGEELCKALVVIFYLRTDKSPTLRGACYWGMASGIGFGLSEAIFYSGSMYNGIASVEVYLMRYLSCVTLHAVWSASVGITLFQCRKSVGQVVNAIVYLGNLDRGELAWAIARVLGVAMLLHGAYDALLTQEQAIPALLVALVSFGWLGWQIESAREEELAQHPTPGEAMAAHA